MNGFILKLKALFLTLTVLCGFVAGYHPLTAEQYYSKDEVAAFTAAAEDACGDGLVIAYGGGFDTKETFRPLLERCMAYTGKEAPQMLLLPTASYDEVGDWQEIADWFAEAGCVCDVLRVSRESAEAAAEKLARADIIYSVGGNLDFLTAHWREKGVMEAVREAFDRGAVLIGVSSGAMCWAKMGWDDFGEPTTRVIGSFPFVGEAGAYDYREAAGILPFCLCPHFDNVGWRMFAFEAIKLDMPSLCLENGAAVAYCGGEYEVIADAKTPLRTAYLFVPGRNIVMANVRTCPALPTVADGESRPG